MNVIETSIRRPVTVIICTLAIIFFGLYVYTQMPQQKRPDTDFPIVTVTTTMSGANASVMDNDVADVLEEKLNGISGVNSISSSSYQGRSVTTIEFNMDKDINVAASDVRDKVSSAAGDLPDEADSPIVEKLDATSDAIAQIAITGDATEKEMSHYISKILKPQLQAVNNVGAVTTAGLRVLLSALAIEPVAVAREQMPRSLETLVQCHPGNVWRLDMSDEMDKEQGRKDSYLPRNFRAMPEIRMSGSGQAKTN